MPSKHGPKVEAFYQSTAWRKARATKLRLCHYVCERCGKPHPLVHHRTHLNEANVDDPSVALGLDNLECLCIDCHNREHFAKESRLVKFDEFGNISSVED